MKAELQVVGEKNHTSSPLEGFLAEPELSKEEDGLPPSPSDSLCTPSKTNGS